MINSDGTTVGLKHRVTNGLATAHHAVKQAGNAVGSKVVEVGMTLAHQAVLGVLGTNPPATLPALLAVSDDNLSYWLGELQKNPLPERRRRGNEGVTLDKGDAELLAGVPNPFTTAGVLDAWLEECGLRSDIHTANVEIKRLDNMPRAVADVVKQVLQGVREAREEQARAMLDAAKLDGLFLANAAGTEYVPEGLTPDFAENPNAENILALFCVNDAQITTRVEYAAPNAPGITDAERGAKLAEQQARIATAEKRLAVLRDWPGRLDRGYDLWVGAYVMLLLYNANSVLPRGMRREIVKDPATIAVLAALGIKNRNPEEA